MKNSFSCLHLYAPLLVLPELQVQYQTLAQLPSFSRIKRNNC